MVARGALDKLTSLSRTNIPAAKQDDLDIEDLGGLEGLEELEELAGELSELAEDAQQHRQVNGDEDALVRKERELIEAIKENEANVARLEELSGLSDTDTHAKLKHLKGEVEKQMTEMLVIRDTLVFDKDNKKRAKQKAKEVRGCERI